MSFALIGGPLLVVVVVLLLLGCVSALIYRRLTVTVDEAARGVTQGSVARKRSNVVTGDDEDEGKVNVRDGQPGVQGVAALLRRRHAQQAERRSDGGPEEEATAPLPKLTRLQKKKQEKEREREERRQAQEAEEGNRRTRQEAERQRQEDRERDEERRLIAEEKALQDLRDEKKRQDDEEYAKWVGAIGLEERGEIGDEEQQRRDTLIAFLRGRAMEVDAREGKQQNQKEGVAPSAPTTAVGAKDELARNILVLSDVAREYGVTVEVLVKLIETLLGDGAISGVFDDRGKFIFVAEAHYLKLALFIQQRGRVSVKELVRECNRVILS
ncbi:hypothetical protein TraAM80_03185 [Trypanosoma rangeli]|uniref:DDRGK domain-containing protein 1 n=1 Tax=Trypanosoma rangeli TaxID=5698 RepID=A0A3R7MKY1_TRYRA|nr:uncharacterized protein TraAM80_03185 [Trypanosoma rangeli]RNF07738.1 hypothetical protein TraAM80_03185 [Trypanosoma rangeli]|eukprot:RNF07738.1 hypothetical protein TraAM80_03185 [Trypanosoma rangeli]